MTIDYLLVDDDDTFRERVAKAMTRRGFNVVHAANADEAVTRAADAPIKRAVIDLRMPGESGLDLIPRLTELQPQMKVVVLTGYGSIATTQTALKRGAFAYLTKPCDVDGILAAFDDKETSDDKRLPIQPPSLAQVEWEHIQRVLNDCEGNISHAAKALGMNRRSLQRKLLKSPRLQ